MTQYVIKLMKIKPNKKIPIYGILLGLAIFSGIATPPHIHGGERAIVSSFQLSLSWLAAR